MVQEAGVRGSGREASLTCPGCGQTYFPWAPKEGLCDDCKAEKSDGDPAPTEDGQSGFGSRLFDQ
jgi:hypothetical protein